MKKSEDILQQAMNLPPLEKIRLIDSLLCSLDRHDQKLDELWAQEVENRITAYEQGRIRSVSLNEILNKYRQDPQ
ncbi:MAG: addiction module protein [Desulfacinum sp.]|jgi:putative addiction module component (TIGR02574 family)|nr:addiction module protein [Desulfacinum sp.]